MAGSIQRRLISITSLVLVVFLTSTGWVLDRTYSASIVQGAEEQLKLVIYALMGIAEEEGASLVFNQSLADPRLAQAESGYMPLSPTLAVKFFGARRHFSPLIHQISATTCPSKT